MDEFKDLVDLSGYTDPITIVLTFHRGLNSTTQDRIAESGTDRPSDMDFNGWFKAARRLGLNCLVNEAFHLASRHPPHSLHTHTDNISCSPAHALLVHLLTSPHRCDPCSNARPCAHFLLAFLWTSTVLRPSNPSRKPATTVARPASSAESATSIMTSAT
jgi:hypothetical protein